MTTRRRSPPQVVYTAVHVNMLITVYAQVRGDVPLDRSNRCSYRGLGGGRGSVVVERPLGRIAQRRVRLYREPENGDRPWRVEAQAGDSDGPTQSWRFACEPDALDWVQHLLATEGGESWRPITLSRHPQSG